MKRGRKPKPYVASDGDVIPGLRYRDHDKRWILSDGRTFREPDERRAINRARSMLGTLPNSADIVRQFQDSIFWRQVGMVIRERPEWVAEMTGIPELARLRDLPQPEVIPKFRELEQNLQQHYKKSPRQLKRILASWRDFVEHAQVAGLKDITGAVALRYGDDLVKRKPNAKEQAHVIGGIRRMLTFARERHMAPKLIGDILANALCVLKTSDVQNAHDPKPITVDDWRSLLRGVTNVEDKAMVLLMLNGAFYLGEVIRLRWDEIDLDRGTLVTRRKKRGKVIRAAVLWPETVKALRAVPRKGDHVFVSRNGTPLGTAGAIHRWEDRIVPTRFVTSSQLRDGALDAAFSAPGVEAKFYRVLAGWKAKDVDDHYIARHPEDVKPATDAIHARYM